MNAELESYSDQLLSVRQDAGGLMSGLSDAQFNWQPAPGRWSMAGCFDHPADRRGDRTGGGAESEERRTVCLFGVRAVVCAHERCASKDAFQGAEACAAGAAEAAR
jgi:hypothetical protein